MDYVNNITICNINENNLNFQQQKKHSSIIVLLMNVMPKGIYQKLITEERIHYNDKWKELDVYHKPNPRKANHVHIHVFVDSHVNL